MKAETLDRCRLAFDVLSILLERTPSQREVSRVAPASLSSVADAWPDLTAAPEDMPAQVQVQAARRCLVCGNLFSSVWVGHRVCPKCRGLEAWQTPTDYAVMLPF
jgi:hypothetical protein